MELNKAKVKDIVEQIKEFTFKTRQPEDYQTLLPTLPNLYGLDVRFKYAERKMKEEKEKRKIQSKPGAVGVTDTDRAIDSPPRNRHARLIPKGQYISPVSYKTGRNQVKLFSTLQTGVKYQEQNS